jgi:hypothetical protein
VNDPTALAGLPKSLTFDGRTYKVHPLTLADFGELQDWVDAQHPDPVAVAKQNLDDFPIPIQKHLLDRALELATRPKPRIGSPEADAILVTPAGLVEVLRVCIAKGDPTFTRARAAEVFGRLSMAEFGQVINASGLDLVVTADPKAPAADGTTTTT